MLPTHGENNEGLKTEFVDALNNFVRTFTKKLPANKKKIQTCINELEEQANDKGICVSVMLISDYESPVQFTQGYEVHVLSA